ncbi:hypothetical protein [Salmonella phage SETP3]|uniref:DUF7336 domain-containing protein n=1 Tax=Salmonella phage SETP3 TaxID=424944 RepID=A3EZT4_9CAUD|nr:hypothetical protein SPSV3_gp57 [Salmonella phage SETP3]ABN47354.1 hypothetical protein [Salmonella phage SETP3]
MKVYIVYGFYHYEGSNILGVYRSEENAEAAAELERAKGIYDGVRVCEWEVQE